MSHSIEEAFIREYEAEAHLKYQRTGSHLRNTIRTKNSVVGKSTTFQIVGKGRAGSKSRHGRVPIMNLAHSNVEVPLTDRYAGEWVDNLDELKINIDERGIAAMSMAYAFGRDTDEFIVEGFDASTNSNNSTSSNSALTTAGAWLPFLENMGNADVPVDGRLYAVVPWRAWSHLMKITEFANADYVPSSEMPWSDAMTTGKRWMGYLFMPYSGLKKPRAGGERAVFYHATSTAHAIQKDLTIDVGWEVPEQSYLTVGCMSQGCRIIDNDGVILHDYDVTAAIQTMSMSQAQAIDDGALIEQVVRTMAIVQAAQAGGIGTGAAPEAPKAEDEDETPA